MTPEEIKVENELILNFRKLPFFERISRITNILDGRLDEDLKQLTNLTLYRNELTFITNFGGFEQYLQLDSEQDKIKLNLFIKRYRIPTSFSTDDPKYAIIEIEKPVIVFTDRVGRSRINLDEMVTAINNTGETHFDLNKALRKFKISDFLDIDEDFKFNKEELNF